MARYARGLICLTLTRERCRQLRLPLMVQRHQCRSPHELHRVDRSGRRRHDRHLRARSRADDSRRRAPRRDARGPAPAGPHLPADGAAGRRADARGSHGSRLRPGAARGPRAGRGDRRDPQRRRHDGAPAGPRELRAAAPAQDRHDRRSDPLSAREGALGRAHRRAGQSRRSSASSACTATRITSIAPCIWRSLPASSTASASPLVRVHLKDTLGDVVGIRDPALGWPLRSAMERDRAGRSVA